MRRVDGATLHYLLGAAVVPEKHCPDVRAALTQHLIGRQGTLHWRDESQSRRELIAKTIGHLSVEAIVVAGVMTDARKQERARRLVLGELLHLLDQRQVSLVVLESRHADRDRHDVRAVGAFRDQRRLSRRLVVAHGRPQQEPLLWAADAVAGAVGDALCGQRSCLNALSHVVERVDVGRL